MTPHIFSPPTWMLLFFAAVFASREYLTYKGNLKAKYYLTPLVTLSVAAVVLASAGRHGMDAYRGLILLSLLCALVADTMLMVVEVDLLKYGILYFLAGHIFYIAAFSLDYFFLPRNIATAAAIAGACAVFLLKLKGRTGPMTVPVIMYCAVIACMLFFAVSGLNYGFDRPKVFIALGAMLFAVSDGVLAVNAFVKKIPHSTVITWALYGPAQMLIALSCFD